MNCFQPVRRFDADALQVVLICLDLRRANSEDPLLGGLLHPPIERGDDLVAAGVKLLLATFGVGAENAHEEVAYAVDEVWRTHLGQWRSDQDDLLGSRRLNFGVGDGGGLLWNAALSGGLQEIQHDAAPLGNCRVKRNPDHPVFSDDRVLAQVVGAWSLGDCREERSLAQGELIERLAEVLLGGGQDAVGA